MLYEDEYIYEMFQEMIAAIPDLQRSFPGPTEGGAEE